MNLNLWHRYNIPKIDTPSGRKYIVDGEELLSVTSLLSTLGKDSLNEWKQRVGEVEATKISKSATRRGSELHEWIESYLLQRDHKSLSPLYLHLRKTIKPYLDRIDEVNLLEAPIYSKTMGLAGTVDCVGVFDDELSVIDFKTSSKNKKKEWIKSYFLQASIYSYMIEELYSIKIPRIHIMIAIENQQVQLFSENRMNWRSDIKTILTDWRLKNAT